MSGENAMTADFEEVRLFEIPALFSPLRIDRSTLPEGVYLYETRHSDEDGGSPCELARSIMVNHYGSVLTREPIQLPISGWVELNTDSLDYCDGECHTVTDYMNKYPASDKEVIDFYSVNDPPMRDYFFSQDEDKDRITGCAGHLRGDFGSGEQFFTSWWAHQDDALNTPEFKQDIDRTVSWLREQPDSPLRDFNTMQKCCDRYMSSCEIKSAAMPSCGFMVKTKQYVYMLRCTPTKGDYNFYLYCYRRREFEKARTGPGRKNQPTAKKKKAEPER